MNAQPAPTVSGKYISVDRPLWCAQVIPQTAGGTRAKGNLPLPLWGSVAREGERSARDSCAPTKPPIRRFKKARRGPRCVPLLLTINLGAPGTVDMGPAE